MTARFAPFNSTPPVHAQQKLTAIFTGLDFVTRQLAVTDTQSAIATISQFVEDDPHWNSAMLGFSVVSIVISKIPIPVSISVPEAIGNIVIDKPVKLSNMLAFARAYCLATFELGFLIVGQLIFVTVPTGTNDIRIARFFEFDFRISCVHQAVVNDIDLAFRMRCGCKGQSDQSGKNCGFELHVSFLRIGVLRINEISVTQAA